VHAIVRQHYFYLVACNYYRRNLWFGIFKTFQKEERKVENLDGVEMFKATHYSAKNGFSVDVEDAIVSF
jgi:hypothetical protein